MLEHDWWVSQREEFNALVRRRIHGRAPAKHPQARQAIRHAGSINRHKHTAVVAARVLQVREAGVVGC